MSDEIKAELIGAMFAVEDQNRVRYEIGDCDNLKLDTLCAEAVASLILEKCPSIAAIQAENAKLRAVVEAAKEAAQNGLQADGGHHKQWCLRETFLALGGVVDPDWDEGIAP